MWFECSKNRKSRALWGNSSKHLCPTYAICIALPGNQQGMKEASELKQKPLQTTGSIFSLYKDKKNMSLGFLQNHRLWNSNTDFP